MGEGERKIQGGTEDGRGIGGREKKDKRRREREEGLAREGDIATKQGEEKGWKKKVRKQEGWRKKGRGDGRAKKNRKKNKRKKANDEGW